MTDNQRFKSISVMSDGTIVGVGDKGTGNGKLFTRSNLYSDWRPAQDAGGSVVNIAVMPDDRILAVGENGKLYTRRLDAEQWEKAKDVGGWVSHVAVMNDGVILGVGGNRHLYTRSNLDSEWVKDWADREIADIAVQPDGMILGIGTDTDDGRVFVRTKMDSKWERLIDFGGGLKSIAVMPDETVLGVDSAGELKKLTKRLILPDISTENTEIIQQADYSLKKGTFHAGKHHLIYAATVEIGEGFKNPGCDLIIFTSRLTVPDEGAEIDVSGADGEGYMPGKTDKDGNGHKNLVDGNDGEDGADGEPGQGGGNVAIHACRVMGGDLTIKAKGGQGGRGQDGGNGVDGIGGQNGTDGKEAPRHVTPREVTYPNRERIGYESHTFSHDEELYVSTGEYGPQPGSRGGNGGKAGSAGKSGDGGKGGNIHLFSINRPEIKKADPQNGGEPGGEAGTHGKPGTGAEGGGGGKYSYYWSGFSGNWFSVDSKEKFDEWPSDRVNSFNVRNAYRDPDNRLKVRAAHGEHGTDGAQPSEEPEKGKKGGDGRFYRDTFHSILDVSGKNVPWEYLLMLQQSAEIAAINQATELARDILTWLAALTEQYRQGSES